MEDVASDGKSVAYQILTETIPNEKITKYVSIVVTDIKKVSLAQSVNEWNSNRSRTGMSSEQIIVDNNYSMTYDVKVERNDGKVFSITETITKYENGKEYNKEVQGFNWDVSTGELLSIESIFSDEEKFDEFNTKMLNKVKSSSKSFEEDIYDDIIKGTTDAMYEYCTWYMTNAGISLVFNGDKIGSKKVSGLTLSLSYSDTVNKLLLNKYRK